MDADPYSDFLEASLLVLRKDELIEIFSNLDPKTIGRLCSVSERFKEICSDASFWRRLIKKQFPNEDIEDDPKAQYIELTDQKVTWYQFMVASSPKVMKDNRGHTVELRYLPKVSLEDLDDIWTYKDADFVLNNWPETVDEEQDLPGGFKVRGSPKKDGTKVWVLISSGENYDVDDVDGDDTYITAYRKKEDAVEQALKFVMADLYLYDQEFPGEFERVFGISYTARNIRDYINKYEFFYSEPLDGSYNVYIIMEVELYRESPYFKDAPRIN
jgi:hypothetical protein